MIETISEDGFLKEVPYYLPCFIPLLNEKLKRSGFNSSISLITATALLELPCVTVGNSNNDAKIEYWKSMDLDYSFCTEYMGVELNDYNVKDSEPIEFIRSKLQSGDVCIVFGTPYYLPYSHDFLSEHFISTFGQSLVGVSDHSILVYKIDDKSVWVYDTTPNVRLEKVSIEDFLKFWRGNLYVNGLEYIEDKSRMHEYGCLEVKVGNNPSEAECRMLIESSLKTLAYEYLSGPIIESNGKKLYYGKSQLTWMISYLNEIDPNNNEEMEKAIDLYFELKFGRFFIKDIIEEVLNNEPSNELYIILALGYEAIVNNLNICSLRLKKNKVKGNLSESDLDYMKKSISYVLKLETELLSDFYTKTDNVKMLEKV